MAVAARREVVLDHEAFALGADADVQRVVRRDAVVLQGVFDERLEAHRRNPPVAQRGVDGRGEFDAVVEPDFLQRIVLPREIDLVREGREYLLAVFEHMAVDLRQRERELPGLAGTAADQGVERVERIEQEMGVDLLQHLLQVQLRRLLLREAPQVVFAPPAALGQHEQRREEEHRDHGRENRVEMEIVDLLFDGQPGNADAGHPAAAAQLQGIVDALLVDSQVVRNDGGDDFPPGAEHLAKGRAVPGFGGRLAQFPAVGMVDDDSFGVEQRGVTAAVGVLLGHVVVDVREREIGAAEMFGAPVVPDPADQFPDRLSLGAGHAAADRIVPEVRNQLPVLSAGRRDAGGSAARVAADDLSSALHKPDAADLGVGLHQRRGEHAHFGLRRCGVRAREACRRREHLLRASEFDLQEPVMVLADLRDDASAHLHGHAVDDASGDEHARHQQEQENRSRHQKPPFGCMPLSCHSGQM